MSRENANIALVMGEIIVAGLGPGSAEDITPAVGVALQRADVVVGYKFYFRFVQHMLRPQTECIDTGMRHEQERAELACRLAAEGRTVVVISSGDAGIYGMASLVYECTLTRFATVADGGEGLRVTVLPGISAFQKAAALLGAPVSHDFCVISLSDLLTPWSLIERRIVAAAVADFVTAVYNPRSDGRYWQLYRLKEIFLEQGRSPQTPVGLVREAGRADEQVWMTTLGELNPEQVDMLTILIIGNTQTYVRDGAMITPRGYHLKGHDATVGIGQGIMMDSFRTILGELHQPDRPRGELWALLHAIHTTADFDMERILRVDEGAVERLYAQVAEGRLRWIVTDVTMVESGIRKGALERLGVTAKCYLHDERVADLAATQHITRTQAGIRLAVAEHPDALYAFGNAPTALMELCRLVRTGQARPAGIVAAPVGFVHVRESKHMVKPFIDIPKIIVEGRKGGSNVAATLVNAILTFNDAADLQPGRDV